MPILTKNETPAKGQKAEFELDKSALAAIVSDVYFQDTDNWHSVEMIFKSNPGKQRRVVKFDASQATPLASFFTSAKARDVFEIEKIIINDFDNGTFTVLRGELTVAEFDINMGVSSVIWNTYTSGFALGVDGYISKAGVVTDYGTCPRSSVGLSGDFSLTFEALNTDILNGWCVGVSTSLANPENGANQFMFYYESGQMTVYSGPAGYGPSIPQPATGNNTFKLSRSGSTLSYFLNGTLVHTTTVSSTVYPEARVGGTVRKAYFN